MEHISWLHTLEVRTSLERRNRYFTFFTRFIIIVCVKNTSSSYFWEHLENETITKYVEPFVGGGAVLINILQKYQVKEVYAFDINIDLINCYNVIKNNVEELIKDLKEKEDEFLKLETEDRQSYFYSIRKEYNSYKKARTSQYFVDAYCSWQRGTNENINKMIRRFLPKGTSFKNLTKEKVKKIEKWINNYPRKILNFKTSEEYYREEKIS